MKTILTPFACETEEKKSRFLSFLFPYEIFEQELEKLRLAHPKANHHVTAFRFFDADKRLHEGASDDGEPKGCAGVPNLKVLQGNELVNVGLVTVRYFGGIKLGTGGMARAYSEAAKAVVETATWADFAHQTTTTFSASFERINELERLLKNINILERRYTQSGIEIDISGDEQMVESLSKNWEQLNY